MAADPDEAAGPGTAPRRFLGSLRDRGVFRPLTRHLPDRAFWLLQLWKGGGDPVDSFREVVDHGAALCIVLGPDEWPGIGRGRTHELRQVARSGVFEIAYVPDPRPQLPRGERPRRRPWWCSTSGCSAPGPADRSSAPTSGPSAS